MPPRSVRSVVEVSSARREVDVIAAAPDTGILMAEDDWCMAAGLNYCRAGDTFENMITFMLTRPRPFPKLNVDTDAARERLRAGPRPRP